MRSLPREFADIWSNKKSKDFIAEKIIKQYSDEDLEIEASPDKNGKIKKYKLIKANKIK